MAGAQVLMRHGRNGQRVLALVNNRRRQRNREAHAELHRHNAEVLRQMLANGQYMPHDEAQLRAAYDKETLAAIECAEHGTHS